MNYLANATFQVCNFSFIKIIIFKRRESFKGCKYFLRKLFYSLYCHFNAQFLKQFFQKLGRNLHVHFIGRSIEYSGRARYWTAIFTGCDANSRAEAGVPNIPFAIQRALVQARLLETRPHAPLMAAHGAFTHAGVPAPMTVHRPPAATV
jgi:hypothetical protein